MSQTINAIIRNLSGTDAEFAANSTLVLLKGEIAYNSTQNKFKVGDGVTTLANLPYSGGGGGSTITVVDALTSTSATDALSANQGRVLNTLISAKADTTSLSAYATTQALNTGLATKANTTDIPTVNNPTITFTQGGASKGSFTLNQSGNATIALEGGAGGSVTIDTAWPASPTNTNVPSSLLVHTSLNAKADASTLASYATTSAMNTALAAKADTSSLSAYATTSAMNTALAAKADTSALASYATTASMTSALAAKADTSSLSAYETTTHAAATYSKPADVTSAINAIPYEALVFTLQDDTTVTINVLKKA